MVFGSYIRIIREDDEDENERRYARTCNAWFNDERMHYVVLLLNAGAALLSETSAPPRWEA
jgi:hypothetical protein